MKTPPEGLMRVKVTERPVMEIVRFFTNSSTVKVKLSAFPAALAACRRMTWEVKWCR